MLANRVANVLTKVAIALSVLVVLLLGFGVYLYRLQAGDFVQSKKLMVLK